MNFSFLLRKPITIISFLLIFTSCGVQSDSTHPDTQAEEYLPAKTSVGTSQDYKPPTSTPLANPVSELRPSQPNANVLHVRAIHVNDGTWTFQVTIAHPDTGWDDYADGWDILTPDGTVIKNNPNDLFTRLLAHPHVDEQPFTRSQSGIEIPPEVSQVLVRAHDSVSGFGGLEVLVDLTMDTGPGFEVVH